MRPTSGLALFAYQVLSTSEVSPTQTGATFANSEDAVKTSANKSEDHSNNQPGKVFQTKGGNSNNSSEVRRPVGICMNVMSTVFCRKVFAPSFSFRFCDNSRHVASETVLLSPNLQLSVQFHFLFFEPFPITLTDSITMHIQRRIPSICLALTVCLCLLHRVRVVGFFFLPLSDVHYLRLGSYFPPIRFFTSLEQSIIWPRIASATDNAR